MDNRVNKLVEVLKKGNKIHIKESQKGSFTSWCGGKVTNECIQRGKRSSNPKIRKKATFAANARTWKHAEGGSMEENEYSLDPFSEQEQNNYLQVPYTKEGWDLKKKEDRRKELMDFRNASVDQQNKYDRIINSRYGVAKDILLKRGYSEEDSTNLAQFVGSQLLFEGGWNDSRANHNYGGHKINGQTVSYKNDSDFFNAHFNMLNKRFPGWDKAKTFDEYFEAINHPSLNLNTKEKYEAYNRSHRGNEVYLYAPDWDNSDYRNRFYNIYKNYMVKYAKYQKGGNLAYVPFLNEEKDINRNLNYSPFFSNYENLDDDIQDAIYNYKPSFSVEPVKTYNITYEPKESEKKTKESEKKTKESEKINNPKESISSTESYKSGEEDEFKQIMYTAYFKALKERNVPNAEVYAKKFTTKAILESNWGKSSLSKYYNFGGIKDFRDKADVAWLDTVEYKNGIKQTVKQPFRKFKDLDEYINYDLNLVGNKWNVFNIDPKDFYEVLVSGRFKYATDPNYAQKLNKAYKTIWG